jgi:hypothetical protein
MASFRSASTLVGIIILVISLPFLLWSIWPAGEIRQELEVPAAQFQPRPGASTAQSQGQVKAEMREIVLVTPRNLRVGDLGMIRFEVSRGGDSAVEGYVAEAQARLELPGVSADPPGVIGQPLLPGKPVAFAWRVRADHPGRLPGRVWLFVRFIPASGDPTDERAISAQEFTVQGSRFQGLAAAPARVLGAVGAVGGVGLVVLGVVQALRPAKKSRLVP